MSTKPGEHAPKKTRGDQAAKEWASQLAEQFGQAVKFWREKMELTAVELSNRTREIGYPITRATIAKIESNSRNSKVDVAEVLTLATALHVAPIDLIFPGLPSRRVLATRRVETISEHAQEWFASDPGFEAAPLWRKGGPHAMQYENSLQLRDAINKYESLIASIEELPEVKSAPPFPGTDDVIELEGAKLYEAQVRVHAHAVAAQNGDVAFPLWFGHLVEPEDAEG
ncbi:helix-turn-helix domain-containing protein [Corynebacterium ureicelerivorans]|uniref:helix-turn-helix domain-containing protein n=1 Tax=Corynebacterium ureicelerivorans TaxID=401472 RepID=UPI00264F4DEF|nr:helix-turn-helix transcriptional regulator [Corynebacterium ureicelerivorans]MDN8627138.1 helix-turn-helix transcriptional regulator [Corynebacterium ureicelerivorans]